MNASIFLFLLIARVTFVKASSADVEKLEVCQNIGLAYQPVGIDHFYTWDKIEMAKAISDSGYLSEDYEETIVVFPNQVSGSIPLYRLYNPTTVDHLYTTSTAQKESAVAQDGYIYEEIAGYVYESGDVCPDTVPLYHLYSYAGTDNFYTLNKEEAVSAAAHDGYTMVGTAAWVIPTYQPLLTVDARIVALVLRYHILRRRPTGTWHCLFFRCSPYEFSLAGKISTFLEKSTGRRVEHACDILEVGIISSGQ
ncbi:hypothetical protein AZE42_01230 [Rhizopogon vesiculosus]|uniref:DUF5648 domain-containing protein n=1 Tax=Rhizopogon vesiculosus TaxID=180088 RepID=A0A1J8R0Z6_9AGAM|nr:hypothetical protein AZE42_01230 [Rhizopogon vesiculosus]